MRRIEEKTGWESARADVLFTDAGLEAAAVHERLLRAIRARVERWAVIDAARRAAEDAVVRANARVAWVDLLLDRAVRGFSNELLRDVGGRADHKVFAAYFPEPPGEVIRLGLESEITRCEGFRVVRERVALSVAAGAKLDAVEAAMATGRVALEERRQAFAARAGASLDLTTWKEETNAVRESAYVQLRAWALENGEERGYADRFFPAGTARATKGSVKGGKDDEPGEDGDEEDAVTKTG